MLAPNELVATGPSTPSAAAVSRVVVVLPLVPDTSAIARPVARWLSRSGSILRPIQPPMTEPSPRPAALESAAAVFDTEVATLARRGIFPSVTPARVPESPTTSSCRNAPRARPIDVRRQGDGVLPGRDVRVTQE